MAQRIVDTLIASFGRPQMANLNAAVQRGRQLKLSERTQDLAEKKFAINEKKMQQDLANAEFRQRHNRTIAGIKATLQALNDLQGYGEKLANVQGEGRGRLMRMGVDRTLGKLRQSLQQIDAPGMLAGIDAQIAQLGQVQPGSPQEQQLLEGMYSAIPGMAKDLRGDINETLDPKKYHESEQEITRELVKMTKDETLLNHDFAVQHPDYARAMRAVEERKLKRRKAGATQVSQVAGTAPLTKSAQTTAIGKVLKGTEMLGTLSRVKSLSKPEYFDLLGKTKQWAGGKFARISPGAADYMSNLIGTASSGDIGARRKLNNEVEQLFNSYRKEITGAAAPVEELKMLRQAMLNMDLSWPEYQASLEQFQDKVSRSTRLYRKVLREGGVDVTPEEIEQRHGQLYASGDDGRSLADAQAYKAELKGMNMSDSDIIGVLATEGYLTPKQARAAMRRL